MTLVIPEESVEVYIKVKLLRSRDRSILEVFCKGIVEVTTPRARGIPEKVNSPVISASALSERRLMRLVPSAATLEVSVRFLTSTESERWSTYIF
jgi:hypothetical protein